MRIAIIVEGDTEKVFMPILRNFLSQRLAGKMPRLIPRTPRGQGGLIPQGKNLKRLVELTLSDRRNPVDAVIALTDVYTGSTPPVFRDADDAIRKMKEWVGKNQTKFYAHAAQYDFEAWLLPYWDDIQKLAGHNRNQPGSHPEGVNHNKPPSYHLKELFEAGKSRDSYSKTRDAKRILQGKDLMISIQKCPQLKSFVNTILQLCDGDLIP
ncbi:MAG: DUF4276 family protein [Planctomycetaceae bacterium]